MSRSNQGENGERFSDEVLKIARLLSKLENTRWYGKLVIHLGGKISGVTIREDMKIDQVP